MSQQSNLPVSENFAEAPDVYLTSFDTKFIEFPLLQTKFSTLYKQAPLKALQARAFADGFKPLTGEKAALFGVRNTLKANDGRTVVVDLLINSHERPGSKDQAAVGTLTVKSGDKLETYHFLLVAPNGDFGKSQEFTLDSNNTVIPANSFWSRFTKCLNSKCGNTCIAAIPTCTGSLTAIIWCLVATCGSCVLRCSACAACNCKWWCKWATGCC